MGSGIPYSIEDALKALASDGAALVVLLRRFLDDEAFALLPSPAGEGDFSEDELKQLRFLGQIAIVLYMVEPNGVVKRWLSSPCPQLDERTPVWVVCNQWPDSWETCHDLVGAAVRTFIVR